MTDHKAAAEKISAEVAEATDELLAAGDGLSIAHLENWFRNVTRELNRGQLHATLYLAEQQRIANLIAWYSARADDFAGAHGDEIREALGAR